MDFALNVLGWAGGFFFCLSLKELKRLMVTSSKLLTHFRPLPHEEVCHSGRPGQNGPRSMDFFQKRIQCFCTAGRARLFLADPLQGVRSQTSFKNRSQSVHPPCGANPPPHGPSGSGQYSAQGSRRCIRFRIAAPIVRRGPSSARRGPHQPRRGGGGGARGAAHRPTPARGPISDGWLAMGEPVREVFRRVFGKN